MTIDSVFSTVDSKIASIEMAGKRASVIVMNDKLFRLIQQEMIARDMSQSYGVIRSPYALQVYQGLKVVTSQVVDTVEVF